MSSEHKQDSPELRIYNYCINQAKTKTHLKISQSKEVFGDDSDTMIQLTTQNLRLKKHLTDAISKRTHITSQCSQLAKRIDQLQQENVQLRNRTRHGGQIINQDQLRVQELLFLNKELTHQIQQLRNDNQRLCDNLRCSNEVLTKKYEIFEQTTIKKMKQAKKRLKQVHYYLKSLSPKQIQTTKEILLSSLLKTFNLLSGDFGEETSSDQFQQLLNPLFALQNEISVKAKQLSQLQLQNRTLADQIHSYQQLEAHHLPLFKEAIKNLKRNLGQVRSQLSENEYEKTQLKKKYDEKLKNFEKDFNDLQRQYHKVTLEKKLYQHKLDQIETEVREEKDRLLDQNQILHQLYEQESLNEAHYADNSEEIAQSKFSHGQISFPTLNKRNSSQNLLHSSHSKLDIVENADNSLISQSSLKNQICKIDQEIMEIHRNLNRELNVYQ